MTRAGPDRWLDRGQLIGGQVGVRGDRGRDDGEAAERRPTRCARRRRPARAATAARRRPTPAGRRAARCRPARPAWRRRRRRGGPPSPPTTRRARRRGRRRCWPRSGSAGGRATARRRRASRHGSTSIERGSRNVAGSTPRAMTIGSRDAHAACSRATVGAGSASTASSIVTTGASRHGGGTGGAGDDDDAATELARTGDRHASVPPWIRAGGRRSQRQATPGVSRQHGRHDADRAVEDDVAVLVDVVGEGAGDRARDGGRGGRRRGPR